MDERRGKLKIVNDRRMQEGMNGMKEKRMKIMNERKEERTKRINERNGWNEKWKI